MRTLDDLDFYTDRTQADLVEAQTLSAIPYGAMTQAQQDRWREDLPGLLNLSDLERIISNFNAIYENIRALVVANIGGYQSVGNWYSWYQQQGPIFGYGQNTTSPLNGITFRYGENLGDSNHNYNMVMNFGMSIYADGGDVKEFEGLGYYACMEWDMQRIGHQVGYLSNVPSQSTLTYKDGYLVQNLACYEFLNAIELTEYNTLVMYHEVLDFLNE